MVIEAKHIYPDIMCSVFSVKHKNDKTEYVLNMDTVLRKEKDGIWYLWPFHKQVTVGWSPDIADACMISLAHFNAEIYRCMLLGKIDTSIVDVDNIASFEKDVSQMDEKHRMRDRRE